MMIGAKHPPYLPQASALLSIALVLSYCAPSHAQIELGFEETTTSWKLRDTDCDIAKSAWSQRRTNEEKHSGLGCEQFHFQTGHGSKLMVAQSIEPSVLIPELQPEVWIKANRTGIRLLARVVIPKSNAPDGKGPVKVMMEGSHYTNNGNWQKLSFGSGQDSLNELFQKQLWQLRSKFGSQLDPAGAYVDLIVLNLYTGPGACDVWVDDLRVHGAVDAGKASREPFGQCLNKTWRRPPIPLSGLMEILSSWEGSRSSPK
jgi:hypothetical protein